MSNANPRAINRRRIVKSGLALAGAQIAGPFVLSARAAQAGRTVLDVVDVGAGTGGLAVSIASRGHRVTVVDPSPDALAAARWRATGWS